MEYLVLYLFASLVLGFIVLFAVQHRRRIKWLEDQRQWEQDRLEAWEENNRAFLEVCDKIKQDGDL